MSLACCHCSEWIGKKTAGSAPRRALYHIFSNNALNMVVYKILLLVLKEEENSDMHVSNRSGIR